MLAALAVMVLAARQSVATAQDADWVLCPGNLLENGSFEYGFSGRARLAETVGIGWTAWYERFPGTGGINYVPDYSPVSRDYDAAAVAEGLWSQELATVDATHTAGLWQRVDVPADGLLTARVLVYAWASDGDDPLRSEPPGTYVTSIGLDLGGGSDPNSPAILWTEPISVTDAWVPLQVQAEVSAGAATLFLRAQPSGPLRHNVSRWDAACVEIAAEQDGTPATPSPRPWSSPTPMPGTPTATPVPTATYDPGTQTALDVAAYLAADATERARTPTPASPAGDAPPWNTDQASSGAPAWAPPGPGSSAGATAEPAWSADDWPSTEPTAPVERWQAWRAALADRVGVIFLGLAAALGGVWLGMSQRRSANPGGDD